MVDLIHTAYNVDAEAVFGGPSWLDSDRFEILAKAAPRASDADQQSMLRALLADRFKLVVHKEEKPLDIFALTTGKRVLLKRPPAIEPPRMKGVDVDALGWTSATSKTGGVEVDGV